MERVQELKEKQALNIVDACFILQYIQQQLSPILFLRGSTPLCKVAQIHEVASCPDIHDHEVGGLTLQRTAVGNQDTNGVVGDNRKKKVHAYSVDITNLDEFPSLSVQDSNNRR